MARLESGSDLESRVTITRLLALNIFALAFQKKKGGEKYLTIEGSDFAMMVEVNRKQVKDAMAFVNAFNNAAAKALPNVGTNNTQPSESNDLGNNDLAARLSKLSQLHDSGVLSDEEFSAAKKRELGL